MYITVQGIIQIACLDNFSDFIGVRPLQDASTATQAKVFRCTEHFLSCTVFVLNVFGVGHPAEA
jgi:hypothetical protein